MKCKHEWYWIGPARPPGDSFNGEVKSTPPYSPSKWCEICGTLAQWAASAKKWRFVPVLKPKRKQQQIDEM